jgi:eukaryotic-like serine/threonine-protein kinase
MGEVYRAVDSRLGRAVALKLLPKAFAGDPERLRRFEQEARATAALNHPAILAVYDVGVHDGTPYLVTELLEGATLRDRLRDGPLPVRTCLDYATQIAEGLAAAHTQGIVHRDLKPENLFVVAGHRVKILDFGLARLMSVAASSDVHPPSDLTREHTRPHTILGTLGYMSPEQARGEPADHRADIFSFGCVLFEMLGGRRAFAGPTAADTISAILKDQPPELTSTVERPLPPAVQIVIRRCLEKEPVARFQSAGDLAFVLRSLTGVGDARSVEPAPPAPGGALGRRGYRRLAMWIAALVLAGLAFVATRSEVTSPAPLVAEFLVPPPAQDQSFASMPLPGLASTAPQVGVSPDGRSVAFVTLAPSGQRQLWIRSLETSLPRAVPATDGVSSWPFWSPDSRSVIVAIGRALHRVDVVTSATERLCTLPDTSPEPFVTGSWGDDGTILFSIGGAAGIYRVSASGSSPVVLTTLDKARGDNYHSWPQILPAGRFLAFVRTDKAETTGIYAGRLDTPELTLVLSNPSRAVYAAGHLLWATDDRLVAQPFDATNLSLSGRPTTLVPSIYQGAGRTPAFWASGTGTLVYAVGGSSERRFRWFDRSGGALGDVGPPALYVSFDLAPDGSRAVAEVARPGTTPRAVLSTLDTVRGVLTPLTVGEANDSDPRFGPGGDIVFARNAGDTPGIFRTDPAGGHQSLLFARARLPVIWMEAWARDGSSLVFRSGADRDAWQVTPAVPTPQRLTQASASVDQVQLSPDRRWILYNTQESGRFEVYVAPVPFNGERWQVSTDGGVQGTWGANGRELYYLGLDAGLYVVDVRREGSRLTTSTPRRLFQTSVPVISSVVEQYRPTADGQRFLFCLPLMSVQREPLRVMLNWPAKLSQSD